MLNYNKVGILLVAILIIACTGDKFDEPEFPCGGEQVETTYSTNMKAIIDNSCANAQCHDGGQQDVSDYRTYEGLLPELTNGAVEREVFNTGGMPVAGSEGEAAFTQEDMALLRCWLDNNFPR